MSVGPLVAEIGCMFFLAAYLLHKYGNWSRHHLLVTLTVFIAWYFSLIVVAVIPLDVSNTAYHQCLQDRRHYGTTVAPEVNVTTPSSNVTSDADDFAAISLAVVHSEEEVHDGCQIPWSHVPRGVLPSLWRVVYWSCQALTWIVMPLMQSYSTAGDFTVTGKLRTAVVENAIYYGTYLLIFGVLLIYVAVQPNMNLNGQNLKVICITASNTWGLFLLVLLLGYGLVEIPRSCWNRGKRGYMLNYLYFKAAKLSTEKCEAEEKLDDVMEEIQQVSDSMHMGHPLRRHVEIVLEKCPEDKRNVIRRRRRQMADADTPPGASVGDKNLVRLHRQMIRALQADRRTHCQWELLVEEAFHWEDIARNEQSGDHTFKPTFMPRRSATVRALVTPKLEWYWKCVWRSRVLRTLAAALAVISAAVVWSEMTFFARSPTLSFFAIFLNLAKRNYDYMVIEVVSVTTVAYLCVCAYYTVFKVRVLNYYYLAPHHQTDEYSLIFCGMMLCRLTPPLCLNFLGLLHLDSHVTKDDRVQETAYTEIMGHMDVVSIISDGFNIYFPIAIFLLCLATYFHLGSRLLHLVGFEQFVGDDDMTADLVDEGRELIKREKNRRQRQEESEARRHQHSQIASETQRARRSGTGKDSGRLLRTGSDDSARAELLRDVEPVDYTEERGGRILDEFGGTAMSPQGTVPVQDPYDTEISSYHRAPWNRVGQPPKGLFDDV